MVDRYTSTDTNAIFRYVQVSLHVPLALDSINLVLRDPSERRDLGNEVVDSM